MTAVRGAVINDAALGGIDACRELSRVTDEWLASLFADATRDLSGRASVALLAVGGYGRGELAPESDLDVLLVHKKVRGIDEVASRIWYPVWDSGLKLGHAVRTPKETFALCTSDLDTATALVTARVIAGDAELGREVVDGALASWSARGREHLVRLHAGTISRWADNGEVAFLLEPNLKEGLGGLRDVHALTWAVAAGLDLAHGDLDHLRECNESLLRVRVALHRHTGRPVEVLRLEDQAAVARLAGFSSDDEMMATIAEVGRRVAWIADEAWARLDPPANRSSVARPLAPGVAMLDGEVHLADGVDPASDPTLLLRVATAAARHRARIDRDSLDRLGASATVWPDPWPAGASDDLVALLLEGEAAIPVLESLDQRNLLVRVLPEWAPVRSKPQRNAFHRFTVDRHLWQTVANAASMADRVSRPDLLVLGALFHDLGKGYPGDHTEVGVELFAVIGARMGLSEADQAVVSALIDNHLLLADVATRRDLSDEATIAMVADRLGSLLVLELLHVLTEADSRATGPSAWSKWKSDLLNELTDRTREHMGGGAASSVWRLFPDAEVLSMMAAGAIDVRYADGQVTVVSPDRPGTFAKVAGVMTLHGLDVLGAEAHSDEQGMAASRFTVESPHGDTDWTIVESDLRLALAGRLAIEPRLAARAAHVRPRRPRSATPPAPPTVRFDDVSSSNATFLEVRAPDSIGLLHRVARAIADLGLDIRHARVLTLGDEVVDAFYVAEQGGGPVADASHRAEITRAILYAVDTPVASGK
ncbi:MAG: [protein-PII] uridylyltransferase [Ilumatobacteraceae bacterium]